VFVDCDPRTGLLDLAHAEHLAGPRTRAIVAVHLGGRPVDLDELERIAVRCDLAVIEDAAHAIGARWRDKPIGARGDLCSFSFHATKNMTTIEGGALVVGDAAQAERVERLSVHGLSQSAWKRHRTTGPATYDVAEPGFKYAMNDVSAAIGLHQLKRLDAWIDERQALARAYDARLRDLPLDLPAAVPAHARHAHHLYAVTVRSDAPVQRDELVTALRARNVGTSVHFRGMHLHSYYRERYGLRPEDLPNATAWSRRTLTLPLHQGMDVDDIDYVASALAESFALAPIGSSA
jgi:dTDP-4-amino-4,6-dideoxygalactose transaminase